MAYTWEELHKMTVKKLREIAEEQGDHTELHGFLTMHHEVVGIDKTAVKAQIRALKVERDAALDAKDSVELKRVRRKIHRLKRKLHKATV